MNKVRILHTADMHLGANVSMFDMKKNNVRKVETEQSALKIFDMCADVDIVFLAGDIFDSGDCPIGIVDVIISKIKKSPKTHFFFSCGNHDPYGSSIIGYLKNNAPENLYIFTPNADFYEIESLNVRVYGASFESSYCRDSLLNNIGECDRQYLNFLCIHGELTESHNSLYNPLSVSRLEALGFDYVALGHVHSFSGIRISGTLSYAYCGVHEPNGFDECGVKGFISGEISKGITNLEFLPLAKREYVEEYIDISAYESYTELVEHINLKCCNSDNIYRVNLYGENKIGHDLNFEYIIEQSKCFAIFITDASTAEIDFKQMCNETSLKGLCACEILNRIENASSDETEKIKTAGKMLMDVLDGRFGGLDY